MNIPTAEDFVKELTHSGGGRNIYSKEECAYVAIEFAKLHSTSTAKAAVLLSENKWKAGESGYLIREDAELIYPLKNIK